MNHWLEKIDRVAIITNNTCNLKCPHCNTGCHKPIGEHPFRQVKWEYEIKHVKLLLQRVGHLISRIRLVGGETTLLNNDKIKRTIDTARDHDVKVGLISNGYDLLSLEDYLRYLDRIILDDHGFNHALIQDVKNVLDRKGIEYILKTKTEHCNVEWMTEFGRKTGKTCGMFLSLPALYRDIFYPCCGAFFMNPKLVDAMRENGWNVYNTNLKEITRDQSTLPELFWEICKSHCYANVVEEDERMVNW